MENIKTWVLTDRQLNDCEMILDGSFNPLNSFMDEKNYKSVLNKMRLSDNSLFPIPITLDVTRDFASILEIGDEIILKEKEGFKIANLKVDSIWEPDLDLEAKLVYGTDDIKHPAVDYMFNRGNDVYISGKLEKISYPNHYDYKKYRVRPKNLKKYFHAKGWDKIIAFQTRNPLHRAHVEMIKISMKSLNAKLLLHPIIGITKPGDIDHHTRVRCYEHVLEQFPKNSTKLGLLPLAMRMGGPREAVLHALIRKNYGCTHIIVGRDHAGPGNDSDGKPFYGGYDAQVLLKKFENEIGIKMLPFQLMVYVPNSQKYKPLDSLDVGTEHKNISGTELRKILDKGEDLPEWFTYPKVTMELKKSYPPLFKRGLTVFFTGLSGSGKSTLANGLLVKLLEEGSRPVTLLDGDIVRTHLSSELGFSKNHRSINVKRIGFVAGEITKNGGVAICAPIAPYLKDRKFNRELISRFGGYIEVYVSTSLEKCEERDSKGLYKMAREGKIKEFTGISDPYEKPHNPEIEVNSDGFEKPEKTVEKIYGMIRSLGYLKVNN